MRPEKNDIKTTIDAYPGIAIFPAKAPIITIRPYMKLNDEINKPNKETN